MTKNRRTHGLSLAAAGVMALAWSCSKDDSGERRAVVGESCVARVDCGSGLACVDRVCVIDEYQRYIKDPSTKRCQQVQCYDKDDCCQLSTVAICESLKDSCDAGNDYSCDTYETSCRCRASCESGICVRECDKDGDCATGHCAKGVCVACVCDSDCGEGRACRENGCHPACESDADCPPFYSCDEHVCVKTGCKSDRECIASRKNVLATCEGGVCQLRCSRDVECNRSDTENGVSSGELNRLSACIKGLCTELGCQTDTECRADPAAMGRKVQCLAVAEKEVDVTAVPPKSCEGAAEGGAGGTGGVEGYLCSDTCAYANNDVCQDGGPSAVTSYCTLGTDCSDCGPRSATGGSATGGWGTGGLIIIIGTGGYGTGGWGTGGWGTGGWGTGGEPGTLCSNTCVWPNDGYCDDGGPGSDGSLCAYGTDCDDCGVRVAGTGGIGTGGYATGGYATGGYATGGYATGGYATGGDATGGDATGGDATGGVNDGGAAGNPGGTAGGAGIGGAVNAAGDAGAETSGAGGVGGLGE